VDYKRIYDQFIKDRKAKEPEVVGSGEYTEKHHISPRSLGGGDDEDNLVYLSVVDHIHAHILLARIYGGALWAAAFFMTKTSVGRGRKRRVPSRDEIRLAAMARKMYAMHCRGETHPNFGKRATEATKAKLSAAQRVRSSKGLNWMQNPENAKLIGGDGHWTKKDPERAKLVAVGNLAKAVEAIRGDGNPMHKPEAKLKISAAHAKHKAAGTGVYSLAAMKAKAEGHRTEKYRLASAERMSGDKNPMYGRSLATNPNARSVICVETGRVFASAKEARNWCGVEVNRACSKGIRAGGYHWKRVGDVSPLAKIAA